MSKKNTISNIFNLIIGIYFMSIPIMATYYWWVDVKKHESFARSVIASPFIGLIKATHWPYYAFIKEHTEKQIDPIIAKSVGGFFTGYDFVYSANIVVTNMKNSDDIIGDFKKTIILLENGKARFNECDREILNQIYPAWGDKVKDKYLPGINYYLIGSTPNGDRTNLARGDALLAEFDNWLAENWNNILSSLNLYGYEIKRGPYNYKIKI